MKKRIENIAKFAVICYFLTPIFLGLFIYELHTAEVRDWVKADPIAMGGAPIIRMFWDMVIIFVMIVWIKIFQKIISVVRVLRGKEPK